MTTHTENPIELAGFQTHNQADYIGELWESWDNARSVWKARAREVEQYVFATSTEETTNSQNPWSHKTHIPKLTQIYDNLGANYYDAMFSSDRFFTFVAGSQEETVLNKRNAIIEYLRTKHRAGRFFHTMRKLVDDFRLYGNCFCQLDYGREVVEDPFGKMVVSYEGPRLHRISPYDIVLDITASSFEKAPKVVRRLVSRAALFSETEKVMGPQYDQETLEMIRTHSAFVNRMDAGDIDKWIQRRFDGFSSASAYYRSGKVELLTYYGDIFDPVSGEHLPNRMITVVDRQWVLVNEQLTDVRSVGQIYHSGWRDRPDNLWAMGPLDNLVGMQYLIDHLENARADAFDQMLAPDRAISGNVQIEEEGPRKVYYLDDGNGKVVNLAPDATALRAELQIELKENQMEAYAGAPRESMGLRTPGEKTKFEFAQLQNAANRLFQNKIEKFEMELVNPVLRGELELAMRNMDTKDVIETQDDDLGVTEFIEVTKEDLYARGKLEAKGASHFKRQSQQVNELLQFQTQVLATDEGLRVHYPAKARAKMWNDLLGFEDANLYQPYGGIDEQLEMQQQMQDAQSAADENAAVDQEIQDAERFLSEGEGEVQ